MRTTSHLSDVRGMTLIELMIAIVLGLLLVAVVIQIYVGTKATYNKQEDISRLQENGRVALYILGRTTRISGFKSDPGADYSTIFPAATRGIFAAAGAAGSSDSLDIRFQGSGNGAGTADGSVVDCLGIARDSNTMNYNRFYIANNATTLRPGLFCDTSDDGTVNGTEIVSDIENIRFQYGGDPNGDGIADYYVAAGNVPNWDQVVSMRVGLVATTPNTINPTLDTSTYNVLGNTFDPTDDRRSRRLYSMIITLRNRTP